MRKTIVWSVFIGITMLALVLISIVNFTIPVVNAQDIVPQTATPKPPPQNNGGNATWTVDSMSFTSQFPKGGKFEAKASSSAGDIKSAMLFYQYNPSSRKRLPGKFDQATGTWVADWTTGGAPQWLELDYWWQFIDTAGNLYQTDIVNDTYTDVTERQWKHLESPDIVVYWEATLPDAIGEQIVQAMADRREWYYTNWGKLLNYTPRAVIYDGYDGLEVWRQGSGTRTPGIGGGMSTRLGGFTTQEYGAFVGIYVAGSDTPKELAYGTVLHEIGHLYQYQNGGSFSETWFVEGDAELNSMSDPEQMISLAKMYAESGELPALASLGTNARLGYDVGFTFWYWLLQTYGQDIHLKVWTLIGQGTQGYKAFEQVTGKPFTELETEFRTWLGAPNPVPPTIMPSPTVFFFPSPTYPPTRTPKP